MRVARTSRLVSGLAILGMILISTFMVLLLNSGSLVNPTVPLQNSSPNTIPGPTGTLVVQLRTNQNESDGLSLPTNQSIPLGEKPMVVVSTGNSSTPYTQALITDTRGNVLQELAPGDYVVRLLDQTLHITIPVHIRVGNETKVRVNIHGKAYPLAYSEESGVLPKARKAQSNMFVEIQTSTPIANVSEPVLLEVRGGEPGVGYLANATVIAQQPPSHGTQWLELGAATTINPVNATSIVLTTWSYSTDITMTSLVIGVQVSADN